MLKAYNKNVPASMSSATGEPTSAIRPPAHAMPTSSAARFAPPRSAAPSVYSSLGRISLESALPAGVSTASTVELNSTMPISSPTDSALARYSSAPAHTHRPRAALQMAMTRAFGSRSHSGPASGCSRMVGRKLTVNTIAMSAASPVIW